MSTAITGLSAIAGRFDAVLVDQFGVLHDGTNAFAGTREVLDWLADRGVPVVALSNSGKRAALNEARLARLGFPSALFRAVITSGELAHAEIGHRLANGRLPDRAGIAILSRGGDASMIEGHSVREVALSASPDLLIIAGAEPERQSRAAYAAALAPLAAAGVPALCINPDHMIYVDGRQAFGPGRIAEDYRKAGGPVGYLGKPGAEMFLAGLAALGAPPPGRCLMIGDSPHHDIAGARAAGCLTLLITSGVQAGGGPEAGADFTMPALTL